MGELIEQLNAIYVQADIFMALVRDKTSLLKLVNQLAASESAILAILDGNSVIGQISGHIMTPMRGVLKESDEDLDTLTGGRCGRIGRRAVLRGIAALGREAVLKRLLVMEACSRTRPVELCRWAGGTQGT